MIAIAFAVSCISANAAPADLTHPETLAAQSAQQLVDLSAIEWATMTLSFEGPLAPRLILGDRGAEALLEYVAETTSGADKDEAVRNTEAVRLVASVRFGVRLEKDAQKGIRMSVPSIRWGELESFAHRPSDKTACASALIPLMSLATWSDLHVSGMAWSSPERPMLEALDNPTGIAVTVSGPPGTRVYQLERETLVPMSVTSDDALVLFRYVKSGGRDLLAHIDRIAGDKLVRQDDIAFADVDGVPWPHDIAWRERASVMPTLHIRNVILHDDVAPFLAGNAP